MEVRMQMKELCEAAGEIRDAHPIEDKRLTRSQGRRGNARGPTETHGDPRHRNICAYLPFEMGHDIGAAHRARSGTECDLEWGTSPEGGRGSQVSRFMF